VIRCIKGDWTVVWIDVLSLCLNSIASTDNKLSPRGRRDDMPPPTRMEVRRWAVKIAADPRPSADGSAVRTSLVAGAELSMGWVDPWVGLGRVEIVRFSVVGLGLFN